MIKATTPVESTYQDVQETVVKLARALKKRYGGDVDEYLSDANYLFMQACKGHNPDKGNFKSRLVFVIYNGIKDRVRQQSKRNKLLHRIHTSQRRNRKTFGEDFNQWLDSNYTTHQQKHCVNLNELPEQANQKIWDMMEEMSEDATTVLRAIIDPPVDVIVDAGRDNLDKPDTIQNAVVKYLRELGWCLERIVESFDEIRRAL